MSIRSQEKVDRTGFAEEEIAKARSALEVSGNLDDPAVVEALLQCEKKCRLSNDAIATKNVCVAILKLCREKQAWSHLIANSQLLAKRRSQSKVAITGIVAQGLEQLEDTSVKLDDATREELLKTLCDVTDGKMYCEAERAKLTRMLSALKERQGDVASAADILQDVNVETWVFGVRGEVPSTVAARVAASMACARGDASHAPHATGTSHAVAARRRGDGVSHEPRRTSLLHRRDDTSVEASRRHRRHRRHRRISNAGTAHYQREKRSTTSWTRCDSCSRKETE